MSAEVERYQYVIVKLPRNPIILGDLLRLYRSRTRRNQQEMIAQGDYKGCRDDIKLTEVQT